MALPRRRLVVLCCVGRGVCVQYPGHANATADRITELLLLYNQLHITLFRIIYTSRLNLFSLGL